MGNKSSAIKRLLSNKNTVTILMTILGVVVLYLGYNYRINEAINPVSVPYAVEALASRTVITAEHIGQTEIPSSMIRNNPNIIQNSSQVIGKVVGFANTIPENSLFYESAIMSPEEMPDSAFADIPDGYGVFSLDVNLSTTLGNSIMPGNYIDLYLKAVDENNLVIYGKFISSIEVQAVKDNQGLHVFETTNEARTPSVMLFYVPEEIYLLLNKALEIRSGSIEIIPVPRNASYSANPGETGVASEYLEEFILDRSNDFNEGIIVTPDTEE